MQRRDMLKRVAPLALGLGVVVGLFGGTVLAQGTPVVPSTPTVPTTLGAPAVPGAQTAPGGPRQGDRQAFLQPIADLLRMTPEELRAARQSGQSLAQIAASRGVDQNTLIQTIINDQVQRLQQEVPQMVTRTGPPNQGARGFDGPGRPGRGTSTPTTR